MRAKTIIQPVENAPIIQIEGLTKQYKGAKAPAVDNFSLTCHAGEIVGLLGHNGAGKSTTLKCLTGILPFSTGKIVINGYDLKLQPVKAKYTFGFVNDSHDVFVKMTGLQYVNFMADAYGVSEEDRKRRLEILDDVFGLGDRLHDVISDYSHGMRQKICMIGSLMHKPKLWILDEPMIGLDPRTTQKVIDFMQEYAKKGNCILFSSHNINSVEKLCDRAVIIQGGVKTHDFAFADFKAEHPNVDLEEYFLSKTAHKHENEQQTSAESNATNGEIQ